ncbi:hypothetical protein ANRL4_03092 [Anaerolineae bacterium]|nr:hypothetical protein ANRL4_03092 [Anaerolineae bacterium]
MADKKPVPLNLEKEILWSAVEAVQEAIKTKLGAYGSPLHKMVDDVVLARRADFVKLMNEAFDEAFSREEFRAEVRATFLHTMVRNILKEYGGEIEKQTNALKQNPEFRARVTLAISNAIAEFSTDTAAQKK